MSATPPPRRDGNAWGADAASRNGATASAPRAHVDRLVVLGYISALSMPPLGFVMAIVLAIRAWHANAKHAALIVGVGIVACALWALIIASGTLTATDNNF